MITRSVVVRVRVRVRVRARRRVTSQLRALPVIIQAQSRRGLTALPGPAGEPGARERTGEKWSNNGISTHGHSSDH